MAGKKSMSSTTKLVIGLSILVPMFIAVIVLSVDPKLRKAALNAIGAGNSKKSIVSISHEEALSRAESYTRGGSAKHASVMRKKGKRIYRVQVLKEGKMVYVEIDAEDGSKIK